MKPYPPQTKIPATYMRGGTSKGVFFRLQNLPERARQPGSSRFAYAVCRPGFADGQKPHRGRIAPGRNGRVGDAHGKVLEAAGYA